MTILPNALEIIKSMGARVPAAGVLPISVRGSIPATDDFILVGSLGDAIDYLNSPPIDSSRNDTWISMNENILGEVDEYRHRAMNDPERKIFFTEVSKLAEDLETDSSESMRGRVRRFVSESYRFHIHMLISEEISAKYGAKKPRKYEKYMEILLRSYQMGGWPCGWSGDFPNGRPLLYWPYDSDGRWIQPDYEF